MQVRRQRHERVSGALRHGEMISFPSIDIYKRLKLQMPSRQNREHSDPPVKLATNPSLTVGLYE
jgi:hypothetical protein